MDMDRMDKGMMLNEEMESVGLMGGGRNSHGQGRKIFVPCVLS